MGRSSRSKPPDGYDGQEEGVRPPPVQTKWITRSLRALDIGLQDRITTELKVFESDWLATGSVERLSKLYEYKPIGPPKSRNRLKVKQIRLTKDTRIHLTIVVEDRATYLLEVFRKSSEAAQKAAIDRSCSRARSLRERQRGQRR